MDNYDLIQIFKIFSVSNVLKRALYSNLSVEQPLMHIHKYILLLKLQFDEGNSDSILRDICTTYLTEVKLHVNEIKNSHSSLICQGMIFFIFKLFVYFNITRVSTRPGKPGKMRGHLENLEISWNFEKFNKYHGKMT